VASDALLADGGVRGRFLGRSKCRVHLHRDAEQGEYQADPERWAECSIHDFSLPYRHKTTKFCVCHLGKAVSPLFSPNFTSQSAPNRVPVPCKGGKRA
jgi:hypothetical protein